MQEPFRKGTGAHPELPRSPSDGPRTVSDLLLPTSSQEPRTSEGLRTPPVALLDRSSGAPASVRNHPCSLLSTSCTCPNLWQKHHKQTRGSSLPRLAPSEVLRAPSKSGPGRRGIACRTPTRTSEFNTVRGFVLTRSVSATAPSAAMSTVCLPGKSVTRGGKLPPRATEPMTGVLPR
jgi:hypothetical protein